MNPLRVAILILWALANIFVGDFWYYVLEGVTSEGLRLYITGVWLALWFAPWVVWFKRRRLSL